MFTKGHDLHSTLYTTPVPWFSCGRSLGLLNTSPSVSTGQKAVLTFSRPRMRRTLSETPLIYGIEAKAVVPSDSSDRASPSLSSHVFSMNFTGYPLAFNSLTTRCFLLSRCSVLDGRHLARSISVLTTARLLCAGLWESNKGTSLCV